MVSPSIHLFSSPEYAQFWVATSRCCCVGDSCIGLGVVSALNMPSSGLPPLTAVVLVTAVSGLV